MRGRVVKGAMTDMKHIEGAEGDDRFHGYSLICAAASTARRCRPPLFALRRGAFLLLAAFVVQRQGDYFSSHAAAVRFFCIRVALILATFFPAPARRLPCAGCLCSR